MLDWPALALATGFGSGLSPIAPGTAGTLVAVPLAWVLWKLGWPAAAQLGCIGAVSVPGMAAAQRVGRRYFHAADAGQIVVDEIAGYLLTVALLPFTWKVALTGFGLFRLLDITKPWPASYFDRRVHNGLGVIMDDLCAAAYGRAALEFIHRWWPGALA